MATGKCKDGNDGTSQGQVGARELDQVLERNTLALDDASELPGE